MDISNNFVPNTDCKYIQSSFGSKIRKISIPLYTPVLLLKCGIRWFTFHGHVFCDVTFTELLVRILFKHFLQLSVSS